MIAATFIAIIVAYLLGLAVHHYGPREPLPTRRFGL